MSIDAGAIKQGQKMMWSIGDYPDLARNIEGVAEVLVQRVGAAPGQDLLDVATGTGNVAIPAALTGAKVTKRLGQQLQAAVQAPLHRHGRHAEHLGRLRLGHALNPH